MTSTGASVNTIRFFAKSEQDSASCSCFSVVVNPALGVANDA